jgi:nitrogen fixation-related uncharacterized protein
MRGALEQIFSENAGSAKFHVEGHPFIKVEIHHKIDINKHVPYLEVYWHGCPKQFDDPDRKKFIEYETILFDTLQNECGNFVAKKEDLCHKIGHGHACDLFRIKKDSKPILMDTLIKISEAINLVKE